MMMLIKSDIITEICILRETMEKFVQQNNNKNDSENKNICFFFIFFITVS